MNTRPIKKYIASHLPPRLASACIGAGKAVKKRVRLLGRRLTHGTKAIVTTITVNDLSFAIELRPFENGCVDEHLARCGVWEPALGTAIVNHVNKGDMFVDIGANIGYHALLVASHLAGTGTIHAFEPVKRLAEQVERSAKLNGFDNIQVHPIALGAKTEDRLLNIRDENMGGSSIGTYSELPLVASSGVEPIAVQRLDDVLNPNDVISVIKIDVEGHEFEALKGAQALLTAHHPKIFMEFSPIFYEYDRPGKSYELISYLEELGYTFSTIDDQPLDLRAWTHEHAENPTQLDILCRVQG